MPTEEVEGYQKKITFMSRLIENSEAGTYEEALKEWKFVSLEDVEYEEGYRCICTQRISNLYRMKNVVNAKELVIGSSCVDKFGTDDWKGKARDATNESKRITRDCEDCGRRYNKGSECYHCSVNVRCAGDCGNWIPKDPKKPRCLECWKSLMRTVETRKCGNCGKGFKPLKHFCTLCYSCYKRLKGL